MAKSPGFTAEDAIYPQTNYYGGALTGRGMGMFVVPAVGHHYADTAIFHMTCDTWADSSNRGWATCYAPNPGSTWKVRLDCTLGGTYDTVWYLTGPNETKTVSSDQTCNIGVNDVTLIEYAGG
jgi:hypothetical protein